MSRLIGATLPREAFTGRPETERMDCAVRAFAIASARPYAEVHAIFKAEGRQDGRATSFVALHRTAARLGLRRVVPPRMTVSRFLLLFGSLPCIAVRVRGHAFAVQRGKLADCEGVKMRAFVCEYFTLAA